MAQWRKNKKVAVPDLVLWLIAGGILLVAVAAICGVVEFARHRTELRAEGTVSQLENRLASDGSVVVVEHVRFKTVAGNLAELQLTPSVLLPPVKTGDSVPVLYRAENLQIAELGTALHVYPLAIFFAVVGILLFDVGVGLWLFVRRGGTARVALSIKNLRESVR